VERLKEALKEMDFTAIIPEEDLQAYRKGQHGQLMGFGKRPCLLVVDMTYAFVDSSFALSNGDMGLRMRTPLRKEEECRISTEN